MISYPLALVLGVGELTKGSVYGVIGITSDGCHT